MLETREQDAEPALKQAVEPE